MTQYKKILVGIDTSEQSQLALDKAIAIASQNQATLDIVTIINTEKFIGITQGPMGFGATNPQILDDLTTDLKANLAAARQTAEKAGVTEVRVHLHSGNSKLLLATTLPELYGNDLIIVGATGLNAISRILIGSNAAYVVRNAACDTLIVRTDLNQQAVAQQKRLIRKL
ncbi:universal stress protein [Lactobacillus sp. CBA3606]|uniref:universal stress protein n=1 Tax=unclassified Lactobacillus TaxID=2620435 RepID=UPI000CFC9C6F|nr:MULTISPECIES: universal stress protein [unclassified Lactobacillus]AVK62314.1 universal stress protein [Lactobacillus sp. CBA3605]AVK62800.1 universal stress protein [Lactobacillus sp. CBA3606]